MSGPFKMRGWSPFKQNEGESYKALKSEFDALQKIVTNPNTLKSSSEYKQAISRQTEIQKKIQQYIK